jgi:hypothetical protein
MSIPILVLVKTVISSQYAEEFNEWYHHVHIPHVMRVSGCSQGRRFKAIEADDKFIYMAAYEFADKEIYNRYLLNEERKGIFDDFAEKYGDKAEVKRSVWELIYP